MTDPQPLGLRRGARRGDHGTFITPHDGSPSEPVAPIGTDTTRTTPNEPQTRQSSDATARAKAAYDRRPKVIFRGVDQATYDKLRAIYKHQLHQPGGIEGWSEWGRQLLATFVTQYEQDHGELLSAGSVLLPSGRPGAE
jgi:hypothetical protein